MATRASKKPPRRRARRSLLARARPTVPRLPLAPYHIDIIALALVAVGIFLVCVAYAGLNGGAVGSALILALRFLFGVIGYALPAALLLAGALVLAREFRVPGRPMRAGALCLTAGLTLAVAAGTLGIGPGPTPTHAFWRPQAFEARGGVVGQAELWVASHLVSTLGAQILAVFLLVVGAMLAAARPPRACSGPPAPESGGPPGCSLALVNSSGAHHRSSAPRRWRGRAALAAAAHTTLPAL